jgi:hypothetical protein
MQYALLRHHVQTGERATGGWPHPLTTGILYQTTALTIIKTR